MFASDKQHPINRILEGRPTTHVLCSSCQSTTVYTVHPSPASGEVKDDLAGRSIICAWETYQPSKPSKILICDGVTTACVLTDKSHIVVCGTAEGVICLWDLREGRRLHITELSKSMGIPNTPLRYPSYSTSHLTFGHMPHSSSIVGLAVSSAQLTSIDDRGMLTTWFISETKGGKDGGGDEDVDADHGLGVSAGLKITQSRASWVSEAGLREVELNYLSVNAGSKDGGNAVGPEVTGMWDFPEGFHSNLFVVAKHGGRVLLCERFSGVVKPYFTESLGSSVTSVSMSKFVEGVFLVARDDRSVEVYRSTDSGVIMRWGAECWGAETSSNGPIDVEWSAQR